MRTFVLSALLLGIAGLGFTQTSSREQEHIVKEVRHELTMLPYYNVFDNLAFRVDGNHVTLLGQVTRPTVKDDAERTIKKIEGVDGVTNEIEVLPVSPNDDRLRRAVFNAIYRQPGLDMYAMRAVPTIHIIVKNGNVTLAGAVANEGDKNRAGIAANGVSGVFSVKNELVVDKS